jgi:hypothetical protein
MAEHMTQHETRLWARPQPFGHEVLEVEARAFAVEAWRDSVPEGYAPVGEQTIQVHKGAQLGDVWMPVFGWDEETGEPLGHPDDFMVRVEGSVREAGDTPERSGS